MKQEKIKGIIFLGIAVIFLVYAFYSKGDIKSFLSGVIFLVFGFMGFIYLKGDTKKHKKKPKKHKKNKQLSKGA